MPEHKDPNPYLPSTSKAKAILGGSYPQEVSEAP